MARVSLPRMEVLEALAELEYAVAEGRLDRARALENARNQGIPESLLDDLARLPGTGGYAVMRAPGPAPRGQPSALLRVRLAAPEGGVEEADTETTRRMAALPFSSVLAKRTLTRAQAEALFRQLSERIQIPIHLDWDDPSAGVWVDHKAGDSIEIPGGLVRTPGVYEDTLALIIGHELSHLEGRHKDEARADYEATRSNLARLLGPLAPAAFFERAMLAAYSLILFLSPEQPDASLRLRSADAPPLRMNLSGYPTLQSRWDLMKAGIIGGPMLELAAERQPDAERSKPRADPQTPSQAP